MSNTDQIRDLNDAFRRTMLGGRFILTVGIRTLAPTHVAQIVQAVRDFDEFSPDNDPYHEHDFGSLEHCGQKIFWKIDYYDKQLQYGSEDPANVAITTRVLTIMLAAEY